jgi:hypothetical protein
MKYLFTLLAFSWLATHTIGQKTVYDDKAVKREVGHFHAIEVSTGIEVLITEGNEEALAVSAPDQKWLDRLKTEVSGGVLRIYLENTWDWNVPKNWKFTVYVSYTQLDELKASSGASIKGDVKLASLKAKQSSGGFVMLKGEVDKLTVNASSGGFFRGYELSTNYLVADVSSGGGVQVTVNKEVEAEASSGGYVSYKGNAVIRSINVNSGGSVKKVN